MTTPITLLLRDGPPILSLERLTVGNAVLRLNEALTNGRWVVADLQHPAFGAGLSTAARVTWSQQIAPGLPLWLAGIEFTGSWESLGALRRSLLGVLASQALAPEGPIGFVTREPDGTWTCHTSQTIKVAMIAPDGAGFAVRRRDDRDPTGVVLNATSWSDALARSFDRADAPRLDPPLRPASAAPSSGAMQKPAAKPASTPPKTAAPAKPAAPAKRSAAEAYEEAVLAARTVVIPPERPPVSESSEDAILAANTIIPMSQSSEDAILAARTILEDDDEPPPPDDDPESTAVIIRKLAAAAPKVEPVKPSTPAPRPEPTRPASAPAKKPSEPARSEPRTGSNKKWSKVLAAGKQVGWIAPDTPTSWSTYNDEGRKTAVISAEEGVVRVCWLGEQATESFEYFEAPTAKEAIVVAFELTTEPKIEPPLAGLF